MTTPVAPLAPLEWHEASLGQITPLANAMTTLKNTMGAAQLGLSAAQSALEIVQLSSLALAFNDALGAVMNGVLQGFADLLQAPGVYTVLCYPRRVDYNRALVLERLATAKTTAAAQRAAIERMRRLTPRDPAEERQLLASLVRATDVLLDSEAAIRKWTRADKLCASDLLTALPFESWLSQFEDSLTDAGDVRRPLFSRSSIVTGVAVVLTADAVADLPPLLSALASWARDKRMRREAESLTRLASSSFDRLQGTATTPPRPPDWQSASLARALGFEDQIALLRRGVAGLSLPTVASSSAATKALRTVALMKAAMQESIDTMQTVLQTVGALQSLVGTKGSVLLVPPVQGERRVQLSTGPANIPIYTQGIQGFVEALRSAANAPTARWCAGVVMLSGAPALFDGASITDEVANSPGVLAARGQAELAYRFLKGPW